MKTWPPNYEAIELEREHRLRNLRRSTEHREIALCYYATRPVEFIDNWMYTYDPRGGGFTPFVLFDRQVEFIEWLHGRNNAREDGIIEKSRDMGVTWLCMAYAVWLWRFRRGVNIGFASFKEEKLDVIGNPDSIFEKGRMILRALPTELLPNQFDERKHTAFKRFVNPENQSSIVGEAGDQIGRGGRATIYFKDESAFYERPKLIEAALSQTSPCKIDVSTVNPGAIGGPFHKKCKRWRNTDRMFEFDWREDPRKDDDWRRKQEEELEPFAIASEIDRNWEADTENACCPAAWVRAARELTLRGAGPRIGGGDVGGGSDLSVLIVKHGPRVEMPIAWNEPDVINTGTYFADLCRQRNVSMLNYDVFGIGSGVMATLKRIPGVRANGINVGQQPTERIWPDGRKSKEKFVNLKAELWWLLRDALQKTFQYVTWLESGGTKGRKFPLDELISLPDDDTLCTQLSSVQWFRTPNGKIQIETKDQLAKRDIKSPDHADALVLCFAPTAQEIRVRSVKGLY